MRETVAPDALEKEYVPREYLYVVRELSFQKRRRTRVTHKELLTVPGYQSEELYVIRGLVLSIVMTKLDMALRPFYGTML